MSKPTWWDTSGCTITSVFFVCGDSEPSTSSVLLLNRSCAEIGTLPILRHTRIRDSLAEMPWKPLPYQ